MSQTSDRKPSRRRKPLAIVQIRAVKPRRPRAFLRQLKRELSVAAWRRPSGDRRESLRRLTQEVEAQLEQLRQALEDRRRALQELQQVRGLIDGSITPKRESRRSRTGVDSGGRKPGNAELVLAVIRGLGGIQRADTIVQAIRRRHPGFGGASFRTQVYQILRTDPRIQKVGRGLYKAKPLR